jgi:enoyl-CoA hydratase/carnithine racemase
MNYDTSDVLTVEADGPVRVVTLNRPEQLNAFSDELHGEFARLWTLVERDADVRAVVLTGAGRAFSAGGSFDEFDKFRNDFSARRQTLRDARRLVDEMLNVHVPVVAAVNGPAVGLGCTLVTLCDIVFMAETAFLADPHITVGLVAGDGGAVTWPLMTGILRAKRYLLTGDRIPASEALAIGLANFVVPGESLRGDAVAFAKRLADLPSQAVQDTKQVLNQHLRQAAVNALGFGLAAESQSHDTEDYRQAPEKFRASRAERARG